MIGVSADMFIDAWYDMQSEVYVINEEHGFHDSREQSDPEYALLSLGTKISLIHSELSEALEGIRKGDPKCEKIPEFTQAEEELADAVIRIMDTAQTKGYRLPEAILAKSAYNKNRPYKHGGKAF